MGEEQAGRAAGERSYRYPARSRWGFTAAALAGALMAAGAVALQFAAHLDQVERGQLLIFAAVFAAAAAHAAAAARVMAGVVRLSPEGLGGAGALVPWREVASVEIQPLRQRMDVLAADGAPIVSLRPELEAFPAVQEYIIGHMQPRTCPPPCTIPLLSPFAGAPLAMLCGLLAVWFGPRQGYVPAAAFAAVGGLLALLYLARRRRLDLLPDRLVLRQGWRRWELAYRDVSAVHLQARPQPRGGAVHFIVLERDEGESVPIAGFRRGYHEAYHWIEAAWRAARA